MVKPRGNQQIGEYLIRWCHEQRYSQKIMDKYLKSGHKDKDALIRPESQVRCNNNMRIAQIEMINSHYDSMDEITQARARRTLKKIGGCLIRVVAL